MVNYFTSTFYLLMIMDYIFIILFVLLRKDIIDAIKLRILTVLGHDYCIVKIYRNDKRIKKYVVKPSKDSGSFQIEDNIYMVLPDRAYFEGSIPSYSYIEGAYKPIDPNNVEVSIRADPSLVNKVVLRAKMSGKLADFIKQYKMIMLLLIVVGGLTIATAFFSWKLYQFFQPVMELTFDTAIAKFSSTGSIIAG